MRKEIIISIVLILIVILIVGCTKVYDKKEGSKTSADTTTLIWSDSKGKMNWDSAVATCANIGKGWRLPTVKELTIALTDQFINSGTNPSGFNDSPAIYWTDNADMEAEYRDSFARVVGYDSRLKSVYPNALGKTVKITASARCVR